MAKKFFTCFTSDMNISFTGIDNLVADYTEYKPTVFTKAKMYSFFGLISDDKYGNDRTAFFEALNKSDSYYSNQCLRNSFPDSFYIQVVKEKGDSLKIPAQVSFFLNQCKIPMNSDKTLPIFSYIGKTLIKIKDITDNSEIRNLAQKADNLLMDEILKYLKR